jgi:hypothetical protein
MRSKHKQGARWMLSAIAPRKKRGRRRRRWRRRNAVNEGVEVED